MEAAWKLHGSWRVAAGYVAAGWEGDCCYAFDLARERLVGWIGWMGGSLRESCLLVSERVQEAVRKPLEQVRRMFVP